MYRSRKLALGEALGDAGAGEAASMRCSTAMVSPRPPRWRWDAPRVLLLVAVACGVGSAAAEAGVAASLRLRGREGGGWVEVGERRVWCGCRAG